MKNIFLSLFTLMLCLSVNGQESTPKTSVHNVGVFVSNGSGRGLSYRYWPGKLGVQVTGIPIFRQSGGHNINIGANLLYTIQEKKHLELYGFLGNEFNSNRYTYAYYDEFGNYTEFDQTSNSYAVNFGLGLKINFLEVLDISTQAGYGIFNINNSVNTNISAGIGLYYHL